MNSYHFLLLDEDHFTIPIMPLLSTIINATNSLIGEPIEFQILFSNSPNAIGGNTETVKINGCTFFLAEGTPAGLDAAKEIKSCDGEDWLRDRIVNDHASDHLSYLLCYELQSGFFHDSGKFNQPFLLLQNRHFFQLFLSLFISILN